MLSVDTSLYWWYINRVPRWDGENMTTKQILQQDVFDRLKTLISPYDPQYSQKKRALAVECAKLSAKECRRRLELYGPGTEATA